MSNGYTETQKLIDSIFIEVLRELTASILLSTQKASEFILSSAQSFSAKHTLSSQEKAILSPIFVSFAFEEGLQNCLNDFVASWQKLIVQEVMQVNERKAALLDLMKFSTSSFDKYSKASEAATLQIAKSIKEFSAYVQDNEKRKEVDDFVCPIIEALQFQDRIVQNLNNLSKMLTVWTDCHQRFLAEGKCQEQELVEFSNKLLACSTMHSEKEIIEQKFQIADKSNSKKPGDVLLF